MGIGECNAGGNPAHSRQQAKISLMFVGCATTMKPKYREARLEWYLRDLRKSPFKARHLLENKTTVREIEARRNS